ncbi:hypothetical protein Hanom_Chr04g00359171 [Helianthus anomalus]
MYIYILYIYIYDTLSLTHHITLTLLSKTPQLTSDLIFPNESPTTSSPLLSLNGRSCLRYSEHRIDLL